MLTLRHGLIAAFFLCASLVACGGSGGGGGTGTSVPPVYPTSGTTPAPQPYQTTIPSVGSVASGSVTATAVGAVAIAASATTPTSAQLRRRMTDSQKPLVYFSITSSGTATVTAFSANLTLSAAPSGTVSLSQWIDGAWMGTNATVTVTGTNVSFNYTISGGASTPVYFALYTGTALPTASPSPSSSPSTSPSSSASPSASPTSSPTSAPTSAVTTAPNTCSQTPGPSESSSGSVSSAESSFFSALSGAGAGSQICLSVWEPSSQVQSDLVTAATNHAAVTVIYPVAEHSEDSGDASALAGLGARVIWEDDSDDTYATPSPLPTGEFVQTAVLPIHAKFALVNGVAYMDGHNWFSSDVILQDTNSSDYSAIQTDLESFPSSPPSVSATGFTTDKYDSLNAEAALISGANPASGTTVDFISESFEDYGAPAQAVYGALAAAAQNGATVNVVVEGPTSGFSSYETCDLNTLASYGATIYIGSSGSEKALLIGPTGQTPTTAWMGSSNMSDYDFIDWGMNVSSTASVVTALQSYYSNAQSNASLYSASAPNGCSL